MWPVSFEDKPDTACENPHCTVVPLMQPTLHIADEDPIPEEQVRVKIAFPRQRRVSCTKLTYLCYVTLLIVE